MDLAFHVPINRVSFGNVSFNILKAARRAGHTLSIFPIGPVDVSSFNPNDETKIWIKEAIERGITSHDRSVKTIKLWHLVVSDDKGNIMPCYDIPSKEATFISFYELDSPTPIELNVAKNFDTVFTSRYSCEVFEAKGVKTRFVPLGFDSDSFRVTNKEYFPDDRIAFALLGKFENRKHHTKIIRAWTKRFGNDKRYYLQCAVYNPFFNQQMNMNLLVGSMEGKHYWNVNPVAPMQTNTAYNDFLNSNHIVIGMSGGEGWGLPEFQTTALGKHAVILNAHSYKDWANDENAVLVAPHSKISAVDGVFFRPDFAYNQGNIFSFNDDEFIAACEKAIERYKANPVNKAGLKLQTEFTYDKTLQALLNKD